MNDLALQIRWFDAVIVTQYQRTDSACGQVHCGRGPESTETDDQHPGRKEFFLARLLYLLESDLPRITLELLWRHAGRPMTLARIRHRPESDCAAKY